MVSWGWPWNLLSWTVHPLSSGVDKTSSCLFQSSAYFSPSPDKQVLFSHFWDKETESERLSNLSKVALRAGVRASWIRNPGLSGYSSSDLFPHLARPCSPWYSLISLLITELNLCRSGVFHIPHFNFKTQAHFTAFPRVGTARCNRAPLCMFLNHWLCFKCA